MQSSTRLDKETETLLKKAVEYTGATKSELVRESIREYCSKVAEKRRRSPWEIYRAIHIAGGSGHGQRVAESEKILKEKFERMHKGWSS